MIDEQAVVCLRKLEHTCPVCQGSGNNRLAVSQWQIAYELWEKGNAGKSEDWADYHAAEVAYREHCETHGLAGQSFDCGVYMPDPSQPKGEAPPTKPAEGKCTSCNGRGLLLSSAGKELLQFISRWQVTK